MGVRRGRLQNGQTPLDISFLDLLLMYVRRKPKGVSGENQLLDAQSLFFCLSLCVFCVFVGVDICLTL
jgi:hypothetical protein